MRWRHPEPSGAAPERGERGRNDAVPAPHPFYLYFVSCTIHLSRGWRWSAAPQSIIKGLSAKDEYKYEQPRSAPEPPARGCDGWQLLQGPADINLPPPSHGWGRRGSGDTPSTPGLTPSGAAALGKGDEWDGASPAWGIGSCSLCRHPWLQGQGPASPEVAKDCNGQCLQWSTPAVVKAT